MSDQVNWLPMAMGALMLSVAGVAGFLSSGHRAIGRRRRSMFGDVRIPVPVAGDPSAGVAATSGGTQLVSAATMTRYHRPDCEFVAGKSVTIASADAPEWANRRPCDVCLGGGNDG